MSGTISRSKKALEEIYESGSNILMNMAGSRERLKVSPFISFIRYVHWYR